MSANRYRCLLAGLVLITFARVCTNEFVSWDDPLTIFQNPKLNPPTAKSLLSYWSPKNSEHGLWVPITYTCWGLIASIARLDTADSMGSTLNPQLFHLASGLLHLATALVAFDLLRRIVKSDLGALLGAAIFAVHPVQVETVAWASGLKDVLCGFFTLAATWKYLEAVQENNRRAMMIGTIAFILGMLSKPTAMIVPLLVTILDRLVAQRKWREIAQRVWFWYALAIPCAIWTKLIQSGVGIPSIAIVWRPLLALDSLAFYLGKIAWPAKLGLDYGRQPQLVLEQGMLYWTWIFPAATAVTALVVRKRSPILLTSALLFIAGMLPVLGLTRFMFQFYSSVADHYLYIAMIGPALLAAWCASQRRNARIVVSIIIAICAVRSIVQIGTWKDDVTFWDHTIAVNPGSFTGYTFRGLAWHRMAQASAARGDVASAQQLNTAAERDLSKAIELKPDYPWAHNYLGYILIEQGEIDKALPHVKKMIELGQQLPEELSGNVFMSEWVLGKYFLSRGEADEALKYLESAHNRRPAETGVVRDIESARALLERSTTRKS